MQHSQHITLFLHEMFVQLYLLLEQLHTDTASLSIHCDSNNSIILTIHFDKRKEETSFEFPVFMKNNEYSHFKINYELFQLLIEQLKGTISIECQQKSIYITMPLSELGQTRPISWR